ncbi:DUF6776 family protein [Pseudomaricurvus sp. HS19]|uniref:DUF6776 family protein n=1 Tax=Pseudomaricurvus sp. HS19 TaxID=2692626 RepID=UPI00136DFDD1|nr:DUF6776 family protein [Pseudomaricurvus sp. HS19]MYM63265.1 hypothetical protein [Pseudomaricurvus sp. HS19]
MSSVKGSKQYSLKVVKYRPWVRVTVIAILTLLVAAAIAGAFGGGLFLGQSLQQEATAERDRLRVELRERQTEVDDLRQEVANLKLGSTVDRQASEGVREEVIALKSEIAALQEDISFYRGLMAPSGNQRGLTIGSVNVISTGSPRQFEYKVVVQQLATRHVLLKGSLRFSIVGRQGERLVTLPLKDVSDNVDAEEIRLRFKYFQTIEGRLVLPGNFEPERIELVASSTGADAVVVEKKFGWLVQES